MVLNPSYDAITMIFFLVVRFIEKVRDKVNHALGEFENIESEKSRESLETHKSL